MLKVVFCALPQNVYECAGLCTSCGTLSTANGVLSDGSGINNYSPQTKCKWLIAPIGATWVKLTTTEFNTEADLDVLHIYECEYQNCSTGYFRSIAQISGYQSSSQEVTSTGGYMMLLFVSNHYQEAPGEKTAFAGHVTDCCIQLL
jgi:hypothetical protein